MALVWARLGVWDLKLQVSNTQPAMGVDRGVVHTTSKMGRPTYPPKEIRVVVVVWFELEQGLHWQQREGGAPRKMILFLEGNLRPVGSSEFHTHLGRISRKTGLALQTQGIDQLEVTGRGRGAVDLPERTGLHSQTFPGLGPLTGAR